MSPEVLDCSQPPAYASYSLKSLAPQSVLKIAEPCPLHSMCVPLPLFRVYKIDDGSFEAEWNSYHQAGPKQVFRFEESN
jgi:hypothetical protein